MTTEEMAVMYENVIPMIKKKTSAFAKITNLSFDEIESEANMIFINACEKWNPDKSRFSTYLWNKLEFGIGSMLKKEYVEKEFFDFKVEIESDFISALRTPSFESEVIDKMYLETVIDRLSPIAQKIIDVVLDADKAKGVFKNKITKKPLKKYLCQTFKYTYNEVTSAFTEIQTKLELT